MEEIVTAGDRKFVVLRKVKIQEHWTPEQINKLLEGILHLRRPNDPFIYLVDEIPDVKFEDIPVTAPPQLQPEPTMDIPA
jgi:hypothetical protein